MTTSVMLASVRRRMTDFGTTLKTDVWRNTFYQDFEILITLNMAQDMLVDYALQTHDIHLLSYLQCPTPIKNGDVFPTDFATYSEGYVYANNTAYRAEVLMGANAIPYINDTIYNTTISIINSDIYIDTTNYTDYDLYYYAYPLPIVANGDNITWTDDIYNSIIIELATVLLGFKEPQTQREFKNYLLSREARQGINPEEVSFNTIMDLATYYLKLLLEKNG